MKEKLYSTRANAHRAAKEACRKIVGPYYQASEGPDYGIHPEPRSIDDMIAGKYRDRYRVELRVPVKEDAPINNVGGGNIASVGIGPKGEPPASKSKILRRGKFAGNDTFVVNPNTFHKARLSKRDRAWWKKYIEEEDGIDEIRHFANRNPAKPVILQSASTGAMVYARYGKK